MKLPRDLVKRAQQEKRDFDSFRERHHLLNHPLVSKVANNGVKLTFLREYGFEEPFKGGADLQLALRIRGRCLNQANVIPFEYRRCIIWVYFAFDVGFACKHDRRYFGT